MVTCCDRGWPVCGAGTVVLLALAAPAVAAPRSTDPRLSATLVGRLEPGSTGRLAVRWDGPDGALLDAWVDLDGDGVRGPGERVAEGRPLSPGIEVLSFEVARDVPVLTESRVWVNARGDGWDEAETVAGAEGNPNGRGDCEWQPGFTIADLDGVVSAMVVFDDGSGPTLYAGGAFTAANGVVVNHVARWDGTTWSPLAGPTGVGVNDPVFALVVFDDGTGPALYVGGSFNLAGGVPASAIARWNGSGWSALGAQGLNGAVYALAVWDHGSGPELYAGGSFTTAGGVLVNRVARWDGSSWSALSGLSGSGLNGSAYALGVFDDGAGPALYAGGFFTTAGGVPANSIARWNGTAWSALAGAQGQGVDGLVWTVAVFDDGSGSALFVGGTFITAGGVTVNRIARWNGTTWSALSGPSGTGVDNWVYGLLVFDDGSGQALYVGGSLWHAGGLDVNRIARWDGSVWSALNGASGTGPDDTVCALGVFEDASGPALYAGGRFETAGGVVLNHIVRWDGDAWSALSGSSGMGLNGGAFAFAVYDDGSGPAVYAGGDFTTAGGMLVNRIARWDGSSWAALAEPSGTGVSGGSGRPCVNALAVFDDGDGPALYAGGSFSAAGGGWTNNIARWNGADWTSVRGPSGYGTNGQVNALAVYDDGTGPALYVGGSFTIAGGVTVNRIARWIGTSWSPLGESAPIGADGAVNALAVYDDGAGPALYAGGSFNTAGGVAAFRIARWDGDAWSALIGPSATGMDDEVHALSVFDDGSGPALFAGGWFAKAGGVVVNRIARWDGGAWSALSVATGTGVNGGVQALEVFEDGTGPALYAGGYFTTAGGVTVNRIARWDGGTWSGLTGPYGTGMVGYARSVHALAPYRDAGGPELFAGGYFEVAGGLPSARIATWRCPDTTPPTDPTSLASTTHTQGVWSSLNVIGVQWSGAADSGGSGLAGYSVVFDTEAGTVPDEVVDVPQGVDPHSTESGALADGRTHMFHLRTCDRAGNCTGGLHLGPFWVDATAPSGPFDLASTSHTPGVPSWDRTVDMVWSAALDPGSGLDGYAVEVNSAAAWACDRVKDLEEGETTLTTPELADNPWWVHLCASDNLGTWGEVVSAGPYLIGAIFADGFESGTTAAWADTVP